MAPGLNEYVRGPRDNVRETASKVTRVQIRPRTFESLTARQWTQAHSGFDTDNESIGNTTVASLDHVADTGKDVQTEFNLNDSKEDSYDDNVDDHSDEDDQTTESSQSNQAEDKKVWQAREAAKGDAHGLSDISSSRALHARSSHVPQTPAQTIDAQTPSEGQTQSRNQHLHLSSRTLHSPSPQTTSRRKDGNQLRPSRNSHAQVKQQGRSETSQGASVVETWPAAVNHQKGIASEHDTGLNHDEKNIHEMHNADHPAHSLNEASLPQGDYSTEQLRTFPYSKLASQPFEDNPQRSSASALPSSIADKSLKEKLAHISATSLGTSAGSTLDDHDADLTRECRIFFSSLPIDQYDECGDLLLESVAELLGKFKDARRERRRVAMHFENEVARWEDHVQEERDGLNANMARLKKQGENVVKGST